MPKRDDIDWEALDRIISGEDRKPDRQRCPSCGAEQGLMASYCTRCGVPIAGDHIAAGLARFGDLLADGLARGWLSARKRWRRARGRHGR